MKKKNKMITLALTSLMIGGAISSIGVMTANVGAINRKEINKLHISPDYPGQNYGKDFYEWNENVEGPFELLMGQGASDDFRQEDLVPIGKPINVWDIFKFNVLNNTLDYFEDINVNYSPQGVPLSELEGDDIWYEFVKDNENVQEKLGPQFFSDFPFILDLRNFIPSAFISTYKVFIGQIINTSTYPPITNGFLEFGDYSGDTLFFNYGEGGYYADFDSFSADIGDYFVVAGSDYVHLGGRLAYNDGTPTDNLIDTDLPDELMANLAIQCYVSKDLSYESLLLDGQTKDVYINVDNRLIESDVVSQVTAQDVFGIDVPISVKSSNYRTGAIGDFEIVLEATDAYGVTATATLKVHVLDMTKPTITQTTAIRRPYGGTISEAEMLSAFNITDNIAVKSSTFTLPSGIAFDSKLVYGNYNCTLTVTDTSGNKTTKDFVVEVYDDVAPVISKKNGTTSDPIVIGYSQTMNYDINTILNLFKATDAIDGECSVYLKSGKLSMSMGSQTLVLGAKDTKGNEGVLSITITIQQDVPPVFILSDKLVACSPSSPLDLSDITAIVTNYMLKDISVASLNIDASNYLSNSDKEGTYTINYEYTDKNNNAVASSFDVLVNSDIPTEDDGDTTKEDNAFVAWWKKLCKAVEEFFQRLKNWFCFNGWKTDAEVSAGKDIPATPIVPDSSNEPSLPTSESDTNSSSTSLVE